MVRLLDQVALFRGYPSAVRTDNGPEFTYRAFIAWEQAHGVLHILIQPGRPMHNGYIESFNGKFRDECLNEHWFQTLPQAHSEIAAWRQMTTRCGHTAALGGYHPRNSLSVIAPTTSQQWLQATRSSNLPRGLPPQWYGGRGQVKLAIPPSDRGTLQKQPCILGHHLSELNMRARRRSRPYMQAMNSSSSRPLASASAFRMLK